MKEAFRGMKGPVYLTASLRQSAGTVSYARPGAIVQAVATGTIVIYTFAAGALADIASDADSWVDVYAVFQKTTVNDGFNVYNT
jgi:hypothetical protein